MSSSKHDTLIGRRLADTYEITKQVGAGSMGEVYAARHIGLDKTVAVKVVQIDEDTKPLIIGRFKSEARAASRLDHPHSVHILDYGEEDEGALLYIVMEFLRGQDLGALIHRAGRLSEQRILRIMDQILDALTQAHQNNIVHRDLKPANIMLVQDANGAEVVKVCDFGIAKLQDPLGPEDPTGMMTLTRAGAVVGTPSYMSPEQAGGHRVDARADLFSCGAMMYHMVTGRKPFKSDTLMGLLGQVMTEDPRPVSQLVSTVDRRLEAIIIRALAKRPEDRFQSAREMRSEIQTVLERPQDRTVALEGGVAGLQTSIEARRASPRPMASMSGAGQTGVRTGTWGRNSSVHPIEVRSSPRMPVWLPILFLLVAALGYLAYDRLRSRADVGALAKHVALQSWGSAEDYALQYYADFAEDPEAHALIAQALEMRRNATELSKKSEFSYTQDFILEPSKWQGYLKFPNEPKTPRFVLIIETVGANTFTGHMDWPERGIRARVRGFRQGNHLLFWDDEIVFGEEVCIKGFRLYDKKSVLVQGTQMSGFDGPYQVRFLAERGAD